MGESSGIWVWAQAHCKCGWIGTEHDNINLSSISAVLSEFDGHRASDCPLAGKEGSS